jgi:hypothetical protein
MTNKTEEFELEQAAKAARIFGARTRTNWEEWYGQSWELIHRGYSISSTVKSLGHEYEKDKKCGLTYVSENITLSRKSLENS